MSAHTEFLTAADGHSIALSHWLPAGPAKAVLQIAHGMAEHSLRYADFAAYLNDRGIAVYAHDHRGHGRSARPADLGHYADQDGWSKVVADMKTVNEVIHARHAGTPVFALGHSMGSFILRAYLLAHAGTVQGAIISATGLQQTPVAKLMRGIAGWVGRRNGFKKSSKLLNSLVFGSFNLQFFPAKTAFDWLASDPATPRQYMADPLCGFDCTAQLWCDLFTAIVAMEAQEKQPACLPADLPVHLFAGSRDPVSMGGRGCRQLGQRYQAAGVRDVSVTVYPGGRHEMLNESNRQQVYADLAGWLEGRLQAPVAVARSAAPVNTGNASFSS